MDRDSDQLRAWLIKKRLQGLVGYQDLASTRISRDMFYRWWNRYQAEGNNGLKEKARGRPKASEIDNSLKKIAGSLKLKGYEIDNNQAYRIIPYLRLERPGEPNVSKGTLQQSLASLF